MASGFAQGIAEFSWATEGFVGFASVVLTFILGIRTFPFGVNRLVLVHGARGLGLVRLAVAVGMLWIVVVLFVWGSSDIVGGYNVLYGFLALACLLIASFGTPILGIVYKADVIERGNFAAATALAGFVLGSAFAFAGALNGEDYSGVGGWHVVMAFYLLAYFELRAAVKAVDRLGELDDTTRSDRDLSAGILLAGTAIACGLIAGRAAAGDFHSWSSGLKDYGARIWPITIVPAVAVLVGRLSADTATQMRARSICAASLVAAAALYAALT